MVSEARLVVNRQAADQAALASLFMSMTAKQHEVLALVAESRTSKEIACQLGVSESAVNKRVEAVRCRAGFPPRASLARAYRRHLDAMSASQAFLDHIHRWSEDSLEAGLSAVQGLVDAGGDDRSGSEQTSAESATVPIEGEGAALHRTAATVRFAIALLVTALAGLGVASAIMAAT